MPTAPTGVNCWHVKEVPNQIEGVGVAEGQTLAVVASTAS
jgi:hypothetical protein